jgi:nitrogen regulatory protein P-II 1
MKEIKAFIRPNKVNKVAMQLRKQKFCCFTVFEGDGSGDYSDPNNEYPSLKHPYLHNKISKLEIVCDKQDVNTITKIIKDNARTGYSGDGLIYVVDVTFKSRIREQ